MKKSQPGNAKTTGAHTLRRFARECRKLSDECVEGTAPLFIVNDFGRAHARHCGVGEVLARMAPDGDPWTAWVLMAGAGRNAPPAIVGHPTATEIAFQANNKCDTQKERRSRLVFPLLYLADVADALASARPDAARTLKADPLPEKQQSEPPHGE